MSAHVEAAFVEAVRLHQAGDDAGAEAGYRKVLDLNPAFAPALTNLGVIAARRGDRIRAFAAEHLCDPGLSVNTIASSFGVAASTIHRSFSDQACSLNVWIWNERLNRARADLGDPAMRGRTITEIAFAWGFNDSGHFSRAFRRRFGCRPRDIRSALH